MKTLIALLALALPVSALAQGSEFAPKGAWLFRTEANQNGRPVCTETWTFGEDGKMSVDSGAERVEKRYRIEEDRDGTWIVSETLSTNHQLDCMGQVTTAIPPHTYSSPQQRHGPDLSGTGAHAGGGADHQRVLWPHHADG